MKRREFLTLCGASLLNTACDHVRLDGGLWNPCPETGLPETLAQHELVAAAWEGLDAQQVWDSHTHLVGTGDGDSGIWVNPAMQSWRHPIQHLQWNFYLNATCLENTATKDQAFVEKLLCLSNEFAAGFKCMLLAFDYKYDCSETNATSRQRTPGKHRTGH